MSEITGQLNTGSTGISGTPRTAATDISSAIVNEAGRLIVTMSDGRVIDAGSTIGPRGIGISGMEINGDGDLIITYDDGLIVNAGHIMGAAEAAEAAAARAEEAADEAEAQATGAAASAGAAEAIYTNLAGLELSVDVENGTLNLFGDMAGSVIDIALNGRTLEVYKV